MMEDEVGCERNSPQEKPVLAGFSLIFRSERLY